MLKSQSVRIGNFELGIYSQKFSKFINSKSLLKIFKNIKNFHNWSIFVFLLIKIKKQKKEIILNIFNYIHRINV